MQINFLQGIISYPIIGGMQSFLVKSGTFVNLTTLNGITNVAFTQKDTTYLLTESFSVNSAWGPIPANTDTWIYWDINMNTAVRSFGQTLLTPVFGTVPPTSPQVDQHWYNTQSRIMYVWSGTVWREVIRVFAAKVNENNFSSLGTNPTNLPLGQRYAGSQVGLNNINTFAGRIIFDNDGKPIRRQNGTFFTTEDQFYINGSPANTLKFEANVLTAIADEGIPQFYVVKISDFGTILLAGYNDLNETFIAMAMQNGNVGEVVTMVSQGTVTNPDWNWTVPGAPLWVLENGALTQSDPNQVDAVTYPQPKPPIARVITPTQIFFDQGLGGQGAQGSPGEVNFASDTVYGISQLSVAAVDVGAPIVVGDNDPRNSNARVPLAHTHPAVQIITTPYLTLTGGTLDIQIQQLYDQTLKLTGGTLTGPLLIGAGSSINMQSHPLINVPTPAAAGDAANKAYVDALTLDSLNDVTIISPTSSQTLTFNGAQWVNTNFPFIPLSFLQLNDTPDSYTGQAGLFVTVNPGETGLQFSAGGGGGAQPNTQIVYGTGASVSSDSTLIYNVTTGQYTLAPTPKNVPGDVTVASAASQPFVTPATAGYMELEFLISDTQAFILFNLPGWLLGTEPTGLAADATVYSVTISLDGVPTLASDVGSNLQTYDDIFNLINNALIAIGSSLNLFSGPPYVWVAYSPTVGSTSTVSATEAGPGLGLFTSLTGTVGASFPITSPGIDGQTTFTASDPTGITGSHGDDVVVDGITHPVAVTGVNAATIGTLTSQLSTQLATFATVAFNGVSKIIITSLTTGITSTVTTPQNDLLQTPGPIFPLFTTTPVSGQAPFLTQNDSGAVNILSNNRIREHSAEIYELTGTIGLTGSVILLTGDGTEMAIPELTTPHIGNCGSAVFEILAIGQIPSGPASIGSALMVRGAVADGGSSVSSVKENYIVGSSTIDVTTTGPIIHVTASGTPGAIWKARVTIIMMPGDCGV